MKIKDKELLIAEIAQRLGIYELEARVHRNAAALESLARQLEAKGLVSVVKTFRRAGASPSLMARVGRYLLFSEPARARSASTLAAATKRRSPRARKKGS